MAFSWRQFADTNRFKRDVEEITDLTKKYVTEETITPVKDLGRYAGFGCLGSIFVGLGSLLILVGVLRWLQTGTGTFHGNWSWVPYLIVLVLALMEMALFGWRIMSGPSQRRLPKPEES